MNPVGQLHPRGRRAVVVFAGGDVARATREIKLRASGLFALAALAREAAKIAAHAAVAVVTHRMRRVVMAGRDLRRAVVKRHRAQERINRAFGQRDQCRVHALAAAHGPDATVGFAVHAPIGSDAIHARVRRCHVRHASRLRERSRHRGLRGLQTTLEKPRIINPR